MYLPAYVYRVSLRRYRPLKFLLCWEVVEKHCFGPPICRGGDRYPRFRTCIFKWHLLPTMCPNRPMVEFCLASSEIRAFRGRKIEQRRRRRIPVKPKFADRYVGFTSQNCSVDGNVATCREVPEIGVTIPLYLKNGKSYEKVTQGANIPGPSTISIRCNAQIWQRPRRQGCSARAASVP